MQIGRHSLCAEIKELSSLKGILRQPNWAVFHGHCVFWPDLDLFLADALDFPMVVSLSKQFVRQVLTALLDSRISF